MPNCMAPLKSSKRLFVENLGDKTHLRKTTNLGTTIGSLNGSRNACRFLAPMLKRMESKKGKPSNILVRRKNAHHAACLTETRDQAAPPGCGVRAWAWASGLARSRTSGPPKPHVPGVRCGQAKGAASGWPGPRPLRRLEVYTSTMSCGCSWLGLLQAPGCSWLLV